LLRWGPYARLVPPKRQFPRGCRTYSTPLVLLFRTTGRITPPWSIRLTTAAPVGIRRRPVCGQPLELLPAAVLRLHQPVEVVQRLRLRVEEGPRRRRPAVIARLPGALHRSTLAATPRARTAPTTQRTGGRRVMILQPTVGLSEADSLGPRPAAARAVVLQLLQAVAAPPRLQAAAERAHLRRDRSCSVRTRTSRSA